MAREAREIWAKRIEEWRSSGQSAREYAALNGVNVWTLRGWAQRLSGGEGRAATAHARKRRKRAHSIAPASQPDTALEFVELLPGVSVDASADRFEIVFEGRCTVRVPTRFDREALRDLLAVMERR